MSVNYDITTTSSTAEITIYDIYRIPQSGNTITLQTFLNNSFVEWVNDIDISWLINYNYVFEGLSPNTRYSFDIDFWEGTTVVDTIHDTFTTDSDGGGGGSTVWDVTTMSGGYNLSSTSMLESVPIYAKTLTRISFSIRKAGSVRFYSTGQLDVQVYLSTSTSYNDSTGVPNSGTITLSGNTGTSTNNFDCTATLSAGTTYYLWVRGVLESTSGSICVVIVPPSGGSVSGNGQTYIYSYGSWLEATPYIYIWNFNTNSGSWVETTPGIYVNGNWI